jgi:hypothetical protein
MDALDFGYIKGPYSSRGQLLKGSTLQRVNYSKGQLLKGSTPQGKKVSRSKGLQVITLVPVSNSVPFLVF